MGPYGVLIWAAASVLAVVGATSYCACVTCRGWKCTKCTGYFVLLGVFIVSAARLVQLNVDYFAGTSLYQDVIDETGFNEL